MTSSFQASSLEKTIGLFTGFLIGVIPVAEYNIPVLITLMSVIFGIKHVDRESIKIAFPVIMSGNLAVVIIPEVIWGFIRPI